MTLQADRFTNEGRRIVARMSKEIACEAFGVPHAQFFSGERGAAVVALARQCAMYLSHVVGQLSFADIAFFFDRDRSTVSHACVSIEDRRESPIFEQQMAHMEKRFRDRIQAGERDGIFKRAAEQERKERTRKLKRAQS